MHIDERDRDIVRSTVELAHHLGLQVVAEGVESEDALRVLREFGCDQAQGYLISRPMRPERLPEWARRRADSHGDVVVLGRTAAAR